MPLSSAADIDAPLGGAEFEALMAPLAPHGSARRVVAGVSGGADSLALAVLLRRWGEPFAVVVDHGLRPGSGAEAAVTLDRLAGMGVPARSVRVDLLPGPGLGARARAARYAALLAACRETGRPDLVVAHHAQDQVETVQIRAGRGSGPAGLAGMPAIGYRGDARLLRPLLAIAPARLRATLRAAGVGWVEDPTNMDPATARGALRRAGGMPVFDDGRAAARAAMEAALAAELAACVDLAPSGHARVHGALSEAGWSALIWTVSGRIHPPPRCGVRRIARCGQGTLHGVLVRGGRAMRELAAIASPVSAVAAAMWDGRFALGADVPGGELGALGDGAEALGRRAGLPAVVLRGLPAIRLHGKLLFVPHMAYPDAESCRSVPVCFRPARPLAGAPFVPT